MEALLHGIAERKEMIGHAHDLPVARQCRILSLARSTAYYWPQETSEADQVLIRRIDEVHLEYPFAGSRMLRDLLKQEGHQIGRQHVATLMKKRWRQDSGIRGTGYIGSSSNPTDSHPFQQVDSPIYCMNRMKRAFQVETTEPEEIL